MGNTCFLAAFLTWAPRRWLVAALVAVGTYLFFGLSTAVLANPVFGRSIAPTSWSAGLLLGTAVLSGLLAATYVRNHGPAPIQLDSTEPGPDRRPARAGAVGSVLAYLAIGCPVCNKVALLLLGSTGALNLYAPIQPYLGALGIALLAVALIIRLRGELSCAALAGYRTAGPSRRPPTTDDILAGLRAHDASAPEGDHPLPEDCS